MGVREKEEGEVRVSSVLLENVVLILWLRRVHALDYRSLMIDFRVYMKLFVPSPRSHHAPF